MSHEFNVVIPARFGSTRLPGKPLADIGGRPMIVRVAERARASGARHVVVATDDRRVVEAVERAGFEAQLTRDDHPSGSDRVMEVVSARGWTDAAVVVNVQGDEPLIPPLVIGQVAEALAARAGCPAATLCEPVVDTATLFDPNVVKVVRRNDGHALYFSRSPVPFARDAFSAALRAGRIPDSAVPLPAAARWYRHIGIYGFRVAALRRFVGLPPSALERVESLEQLRMLEHGMELLVLESAATVPGGVDTPEDLERARRAFAAHGHVA
jgi:3-deoxy-manno-octulosonate cytidylyltransferase (CMP-KDO synthetase)